MEIFINTNESSWRDEKFQDHMSGFIEHGFIEHARQRSLATHGASVCCARGRGVEGQGSPASGNGRPSPTAPSSLSSGMILNLFLPSEPLFALFKK